MPNTIQGEMTIAKQRFAIVVSRFNEIITSRLVGGAVDTLVRHGGSEDAITVIHVPGAFEIPQAAKVAATGGAFDAVICVGCVIRGATPHFEYVASQAARGIAQIALECDIPVTFGLLTTDTLEQAIERAGSKAGNKGADAAASAIEMVNVLSKIPTAK